MSIVNESTENIRAEQSLPISMMICNDMDISKESSDDEEIVILSKNRSRSHSRNSQSSDSRLIPNIDSMDISVEENVVKVSKHAKRGKGKPVIVIQSILHPFSNKESGSYEIKKQSKGISLYPSGIFGPEIEISPLLGEELARIQKDCA